MDLAKKTLKLSLEGQEQQEAITRRGNLPSPLYFSFLLGHGKRKNFSHLRRR